MADLEISKLPPVTTPAPADEFATVNDLVSKKITRAQLHSLELGEILVLPSGNDATNPELQFSNSGIYQDLSNELSFSQGAVKVGNLTTPALGGMLVNNLATGSGLERVLTISDIGSFGEYRTTFDATVGTFPVTSFQGDWFNCTVAGTVGGQPFIVGDILIALVDNPSTTVFAANWSIVPHIGVTTLAGLSDVDLTGQANNDLLFRSGGLWVDTAGALTWDGSNLSATNFGGILEANLFDLSATPAIQAGVLRNTNNANVDGPNFDVQTTNKTPAEYAYKVTRNSAAVAGFFVDGDLLAKDILATSYGGIIEANLLDKSAAETITGKYIFNSNTSVISFWNPDSTTAPMINIGSPTAPNHIVGLASDTANDTISFNLFHSAGTKLSRSGFFSDDLTGIWGLSQSWANSGQQDFVIRMGGVERLRLTQPGVLSLGGSITAASYGGITEANLLDKSAAEIVAGPWEFTAAMTISQGGGEKLILKDSNSTGNAVLNFIAFKDMNDLRQGVIGFGSSSNDDLLMATDGGFGDILLNPQGTTALRASNTAVAISVPLTATSYDGVLAANLLDKSANEVVTGAWSVPSLINTQNGAYTLVLGDAGKTIRKATSTASITHTIPANASVAYPIGILIAWQNDGTVSMTIAITTDTLTGTDGVTGSRTLSANATAVIQKVTATSWKYAASDL